MLNKASTAGSLIVLALVILCTITGVTDRASGPTASFVTSRGETATISGSGLYQYDPAAVAREGVVWDAVNLAIGVPIMIIAIVLARRGSLRGRILLIGIHAYFLYVYLMYATMTGINRLFLAYIAIFAIALVTLVPMVIGFDVAGLAAQIKQGFPRRLLIWFSLLSSGFIAALWLRLSLSVIGSGVFPPELAGMTTLETQALDLGLVVPLAISSAVLLRRRSPWGYLLAGMHVTFGLVMFIAIPAWIVVPLVQDGKIRIAEAIPFVAVSLVGLLAATLYFRGIAGESAGIEK